MNRPAWCAVLTLLVALVATKAYADITFPKPFDLPEGKTFRRFKVSTDSTKDCSFLRVPRKELGLFQDAAGQKQSSWSPASTRSIVAALAASMGLASVFLLRVNRQTKIAILFVTGLIASGAVAQAWWNAGPPPSVSTPPVGFTPAVEAIKKELNIEGGILVIEVTDADRIEIVIGTKPIGKGAPHRRRVDD